MLAQGSPCKICDSHLVLILYAYIQVSVIMIIVKTATDNPLFALLLVSLLGNHDSKNSYSYAMILFSQLLLSWSSFW